jgi:hypothetical protein
MSSEAQQSSEQHKLLANLFHLISQPMTALQCSLEFALNTAEDPQQCRPWIEAALENSERLRCRLSLAREIAEAAEPGDATHTVELRSLLEEALSEAEPFFEEAVATPRLQCEEIEVPGERSRLLRAFFYLLQHLKAADQPAPRTPEVRVERKAELIEVRFLGFVLRGNVPKDQVASHLAVAKETFESCGGGLLFFCFAGNDALVRVFLRAPQAQLDLYQEAAQGKPATSSIGTTTVFPQVS